MQAGISATATLSVIATSSKSFYSFVFPSQKHCMCPHIIFLAQFFNVGGQLTIMEYSEAKPILEKLKTNNAPLRKMKLDIFRDHFDLDTLAFQITPEMIASALSSSDSEND